MDLKTLLSDPRILALPEWAKSQAFTWAGEAVITEYLEAQLLLFNAIMAFRQAEAEAEDQPVFLSSVLPFRR